MADGEKQSEDILMDAIKFGYPAASVMVCFIGTLANLASLVYFIKKKEKSIGDNLLMLLNSTDLLLSICATSMTVFISIRYQSPEGFTVSYVAGILVPILYLLLIDGTAYATCLLSVTRAIGIAFPFYQIKGKLLVIVGIMVFVLMEVICLLSSLVGIFLQTGIIILLLVPRIVITSIFILVVVSATVVAVYKLTRKDILGLSLIHI